MTTTTRTESNGKARRSLADQIERLDSILDGLDDALSGAVRDAVERGVRQAVQTVMAEVLTNPHLHEHLRRAARPEDRDGEPKGGNGGMFQRMWSAAGETLGRAARLARAAARRGGVMLIAAGGVLAAGLYVARTHIASAAAFVYGHAKTAVRTVGAALFRLLPAFAFCGI
jgi:hypothetical protein